MKLETSLAAVLTALLVAALACATALAAPIMPTSDDQVVETLPARSVARLAPAAGPLDAPAAVRRAALLMAQARSSGDPRPAGQALATLRPWTDAATAPVEVLLMQANVQQYLHQFDAAAHLLEQLLARDARQPQAWLTLATVRRVQGRYADSDRACTQLAALGSGFHGAACRAENQALRGEFDAARQRFESLLAAPRLEAATRNWLLTSIAELEQRAARNDAADAAYRAALAAQREAYSLIAYADFLIERKRERDAISLLAGEPRSDAVLLRLAIAGTRGGTEQAAADAAEMRARIVQANLRPQAQAVHAREQALFALWVDADAQRSLALARSNLRTQREPVDVLLLAQAGQAAGDAGARTETDRLRKEMGLHDRRLDALP